MRRVLFILSISFLLYGVAQAGELKLGYIDLQRALLESEAGRKATGELEALFKPRQQAVNDKRLELAQLKDEIDKQSAMPGSDALKAKKNEFDRKVRELQRFAQDAESEFTKKQQELTRAILKDLKGVIEKFQADKGYTLIFEKNEAGILAADASIDITDTIIKRYNSMK